MTCKLLGRSFTCPPKSGTARNDDSSARIHSSEPQSNSLSTIPTEPHQGAFDSIQPLMKYTTNLAQYQLLDTEKPKDTLRSSFTLSKPILDITLSGIETSALLDSGSSHSFINSNMLLLLQNKCKKLVVNSIDHTCSVANAHVIKISQSTSATVHFDQFSWRHTF